jgi:nitrate/nitrite transport system substrate-binding protein
MNQNPNSSLPEACCRRFARSLAIVVIALVGMAFGQSVAVYAASLEKTVLKFGFIKLTDCAPLVIAKEKGFFDDEGLDVTLEAQANWKILLDRVISGELDGAHMLAGQPIAATIGFGTKAHIITAFSMDLNGNGITVSKDIWQQMQDADPALKGDKIPRPVKADALKLIVQQFKADGTPLKLGMVFPVSTHNYYLRYWLAAGGIKPGYYTADNINGTSDADVLLSVTPPPQMPATMAQGTIQGYCVGEPWNQQAVLRGIGVSVVTDYEVWKNNPEKVFGVTAEWARKYPNTHIAVIKALIRAGKWLDASPENRKEACKILSMPQYVGADYKVIANSMTGTWEYFPDDTRDVPDFNVFFRYNATYPYYSDCIWFLTQMRRWGQISEYKSDQWYADTAKEVYRPDIYLEAAKELVQEGKLKADEVPKTDGYKPPTADFIDGIQFDAHQPNAYIAKFPIGLKD